MDGKHLRDEQRRIRKNCPTLYPGARPGWECGPGWTLPLEKLSYRLEALNEVFERSFGVYAEAEQVKEKFGTLRFYFSVKTNMRAAPEALRRAASKCAELISRKVDFSYKCVVVAPHRTVLTCREVKAGEVRDLSFNETAVPSRDRGSCYIYGESHVYEKKRRVPTRNRAAWLFMRACCAVERILCCTYKAATRRQIMARQCLDDLAEELAGKTEDECYSTCEECGRKIGDKYSPRCSSVGWIRYLCERCARESGHMYIKNGVKYGKTGEKIEDLPKDQHEDEA
jgi:hypothetical protein